MKTINNQLVLIGVIVTILLSACATPDIYRPEVEMFQKATSEIDSYLKAKQKSVTDIRDIRRDDTLKTGQPIVSLSKSCRTALEKLNQFSPDKNIGAECKLVPDDDHYLGLFNPSKAIENSIAFTEAVANYAQSLDKIARSGSKEVFMEAAMGLGDSVISLAGSAAEAANRKKPDPETFTPIASLIALGAHYNLENKKAEALRDGANIAHEWIVLGSEAVSQVMLAAQFEMAAYSYDKVVEQLDKVNEAKDQNYIQQANKAINDTSELRRQLSENSGLPLKKLPKTHQKLLNSFEDRKRHLSGAIVIAQDLYKTARDAYDAVKK